MPTPPASEGSPWLDYVIRQQAQQIADLERSLDTLRGALMDQSQRSSLSRDPFLQSPGGNHSTLSKTPADVLLPGEAPRNPDQLHIDDNPAPDSRSPLELVVSQQTAIRALVRHYGWVHNGANVLVRPYWPFQGVVNSPASTTAEPPLIELIETPGEIADLGDAAAAAVA